MHFENTNPATVDDVAGVAAWAEVDGPPEGRTAGDGGGATAADLLDRAVAAAANSRLGVDVSPDMVTQLASERPDRAVFQTLFHVCVLMERRSVARADRPCLKAWIDVHARLAGSLSRPTNDVRPAPLDLDLEVARAWDRLFVGGQDPSEIQDLEALASEAGRQKADRISVEVAVLLAFRALADGRAEHALVMARRAVELAQNARAGGHELPLALVVLARSYRQSAKPHLGLAALGAIPPDAKGPWADWIQWERRLAGGTRARVRVSTSSLPSAPPLTTRDPPLIAQAGRLLGRVFLTVTRPSSTLAEFESAVAALKTCVSCCPFLDAEVTALLAVLDGRSEHVPAAVQDWVRGNSNATWCGFEAMELALRTLPARAFASAMVLGMPGARGRRFLSSGAAVFPNAQKIEYPQTSPAVASTRTETGVAVLALAGPDGISCEEFFRSVYGLRFSAKRHQSVLDVLCYRMRLLVGDAGEVRRVRSRPVLRPGSLDSKMLLVLKRPIVVRDPRCGFSMTDRILHVVAMFGGDGGVWSTRISSELNLPLRTAQSVLQELVKDGQCVSLRDGRRVRYQIHFA